tara:strand:+ start:1901 stop:2767 length:867 start_codon:yes stop_codon:yes gene_type:complete
MKISNKKRFKKARERTGLSKKALKSVIRKLGIKDFDSKKELQRVVRYSKEQNNSSNNSNSNNSNNSNNSGSSDLKDRYNELLQKYNDQTASVSNLESEVGTLRDKVEDYDDEISDYESKVGTLEGQVGDYRSRVSTLTDQYSGALTNNQALTAERDKARQEFADQSAAYEAAMQERDRYREMDVNEQLSGLRGGATAGGANQTSYATGGLASGRSGYSSSTQDRDKGLADYVMQQGGVTDSVLSREGPVVQLIGRRERRQARRRARQQARSMTSGAGTGSYYASRFGG